jgi:hypothetical protein
MRLENRRRLRKKKEKKKRKRTILDSLRAAGQRPHWQMLSSVKTLELQNIFTLLSEDGKHTSHLPDRHNLVLDDLLAGFEFRYDVE